TFDDCAFHQSLSTVYGVIVILAGAMPRLCTIADVPLDGTMTWSACRKRKGQKSFLNQTFHCFESRGARLCASVPNRKAVRVLLAARRAIQNEARTYPTKHSTASNFPERIRSARPRLFSPQKDSSPDPLLGISVHG